MTDQNKFSQALRDFDKPDELASMASAALSLAGSSADPATWLFASMLLLRLATLLDGNPPSGEDWTTIQTILNATTDALDRPDMPALNSVASAYLEWRRPSAMH